MFRSNSWKKILSLAGKLGFVAIILTACGDTTTNVTATPAVTTSGASNTTSPLAAQTKSADSVTPLTFYPVKTDRYELYATSEKDLNQARNELDNAIQQFRRYFTENPPKIGVVVADTPEQAQSYLEQLKKAGLPALFHSYKAGPVGGKIMSPDGKGELLPALGLVVTEAESGKGVKLQEVLPVGVPQGADLKKDDVITAFNGQAVSNIDSFKALYEQVTAGSKIELKLLRGGQEITTSFNKPTASSVAMIGGPVGADNSRLAQEAGTKFLEAYTETKLGKTLSDEEKAKYLPGWFVEGVASLHASQSSQQARRTDLKQFLKDGASLIPLAELLKMSRLALATLQGQPVPVQIGDGAGANLTPDLNRPVLVTPASGQTLSGDQISGQPAGSGPIKPGPEALFGPEAASFAQFLVEKEGPKIIDRIAEGLRAGKTLPEILEGAKTLPSDLNALDKAWQEWLTK